MSFILTASGMPARAATGCSVRDPAKTPDTQNINLARFSVSQATLTKLLELFSDLQFKAYYCSRLKLQPNGEAAQKIIDRNKDSAQSRLIKYSIGAQVLEKLRCLGTEPLDCLREFGKVLLGRQNLACAFGADQNFENTLLTGLQDRHGSRFHLSPQLLLSVADIFHQSWLSTVSKPDFQNHRPATVRFLSPAEQIKVKTENFSPLLNYDSLTVFGLCQELAKLSATKYQDLKNICAPGNPSGLDLSFQQRSLAVRDDYPVDGLLGSDRVSLRESRKLRLRTFPKEASANVISALHLYGQQLEKQETASLMPVVLREIDQRGVFEPDDLVALAQKLKEIRKSRTAFKEALRSVVESGFLGAYFDPNSPGQSLLEIVFQRADKNLRAVIRQFEDDYKQKKSALGLSAPGSSALKLISTYQEFAPIEDLVKKLIEGHKRTADDPEFRARGGILFDYYDSEFWQSFFQRGGNLAASLAENKVQGFALYIGPATIAHFSDLVPEETQDHLGRSTYAELILTNASRSSGTLNKLLYSMLLHSQLLGSDSFDFSVYDFNERAFKAYAGFGFSPRVHCPFEISDGAFTMFPYRLPLNPAELKRRLELQRALLQQA